ncbi:MAG: arylsulfotransferase family protein [Geminicoccaceae bacterium]
MKSSDNSNRIALVACGAGLVLLSFLGGMLIAVGEVFPANVVREAHSGAKALIERHRELKKGDQYAPGLWEQARTPVRGVAPREPHAVFEGFTLYSSAHEHAVRLIDMAGREVHVWRIPYRSVWESGARVKEPLPDGRIFLRSARMQPDGSVLAIFEAVGDTPYGYGLVKVDRHSRIVWSYLEHAHHDLDIAPDGRIVTLIQEVSREDIGRPNLLARARLDDFVVVLSPDGKELRRVHLTKALLNSRYARLLDLVPWYALPKGDILHANAVDYIDAAQAASFPYAKEGQLLVSFREIGTIAVLDVEREEVVWAMRGAWIGQHDPDILPNGNVLMFDNNGDFGDKGRSRVIEVDPRTTAISWSYSGSGERPMESVIRSSQQRLPNGNTLFDESDGGRLVEVDPAGEVVWEFVNPVRGGERDGLLPVVMLGERQPLVWFEPGFQAMLRPSS